MSSFHRNQCPVSSGIGVQFAPESAVEQAYDRLQAQDDDSGDGGNASSSAAGTTAAGHPSPNSDNGEIGHSSGPANDEDRQNEDGDDESGDEDEDRQDGEDRPEDGQDDDGAPDAPPSHDPSGTGEVMDADVRASGDDKPADAPVDITAEEQAWDEAMHQALNIARAEGRVPGQVEETIRGAHAGTLDWRTLLRRYMTDAASHDYSWSVPNRRFIDGGLYLPSIRSEGIETIAVIVDTSGSLPTDTLAGFWAELREVAAEIGPETVVVLQVDAAVQDATEYAPDEIAVKGRGGTDFRPGFAWLDEHGIRPGVCLYFTDTECSDYPEAEPAFPGLWCDYGDGDSPWRCPAPWGERVDIAV